MLDNQELRPNIHGGNNESSIAGGVDQAGSTSPVYSIADEDRTQFAEIAEERPVHVIEANKDIEKIDFSNIDDDDDDDLIHNKTSSAANNAASKIFVEVDIHKDMSSLSLRDVGDPSSDVNCSQSILNNFEGLDHQPQQNKRNIVAKPDAGGLLSNVTYEEKSINVMQAGSNTTLGKILNEKTTPITESNETITTSIAPNKPIILCNTKSNSKYKNDLVNKEPTSMINSVACSLTVNSNHNDNITLSLPSLHPITNYIPVSQTQTLYDSNKTCTIHNSSQKLKDANHFTEPAQIYKVVNPLIVEKVDELNLNIPPDIFNVAEKGKPPIKAAENAKALINNTALTQNDSTTIKKKRSRKKKVVNEKEIKPKNKKVYRRASKSNKSVKTETIPIYNENVINDLSWVENIRFVREIQVDENDPKLHLEDSFWDNYHLPANWSENEFM